MTKIVKIAAKNIRIKMIQKEKISHIYKLYSKEIYRYLYKLTGSRESSEDLLQEVFEKFISYTVQKDIHEEKYRAFLYRTAHNECVNFLIKLKKIQFDNIDALEETLKCEDRNIEDCIADELNLKIYRVLETISPESRSMFMLHKENGMTYEEIAGLLYVSSRTVRRKIRQVLNVLFEELKKEGFITA
jgi:RNA polymerase sigma-70 factor (ECF subfamily)